jgi:hypothetical protein
VSGIAGRAELGSNQPPTNISCTSHSNCQIDANELSDSKRADERRFSRKGICGQIRTVRPLNQRDAFGNAKAWTGQQAVRTPEILGPLAQIDRHHVDSIRLAIVVGGM